MKNGFAMYSAVTGRFLCGEPKTEEFEPIKGGAKIVAKGYDWNVLGKEYWVTGYGEVLYPERGEMELSHVKNTMAFLMQPSNIKKMQSAMAIQFVAENVVPMRDHYPNQAKKEEANALGFVFMPEQEFFEKYVLPSRLWEALNVGLSLGVKKEQREQQREREKAIKKCNACECHKYF